MPATPVLSNGGTSRGLPISCFLNEANDLLEGIVGLWNENVWLAARGGGIGSYWGNLRSIGEKVGMNGKTSGVVPFIRVMDLLTLAISQGSLRRGSAACYLPVNHPEIEEFIEIRRPTGGDPNRKALNLHHGLLISDAFMRAVENDEEWALVSPRTARCSARSGRGALDPHPDGAHRDRRALPGVRRPREQRPARASQARRPRGQDLEPVQRIRRRQRYRRSPATSSAPRCCLSSLNLETYLEWHEHPTFIEDVMRFLDNVLQSFIDTAGSFILRPRHLRRYARALGRPRRHGLPVRPAG